MYCKYCGNIIDDDSSFCRFCGKNVQSNKEKNDSNNNNNKIKKVFDRPLHKLYCALVVDGDAHYKDILINIVENHFSEICSIYYAHREMDSLTYAKICDARRSMFGKDGASDYYFKSSVKLAPDIEVSLKRKEFKNQEDGKVCFFNGNGQLITERRFSLDRFSLFHYALEGVKSHESQIKLMLSNLLSDEQHGVKYEILPFDDLIDKLYGDAYLIFDTETTGLPIDENAPIEDDKNWPHLVQLSWVKIDIEDGSITSNYNFIIRPDGFTIPEEATNIHGITNEIAQRRGKPLNYVLKLFADDLETTNVLVGHNVLFDINMVEAEYNRIGWDNYVTLIESIRTICTMNSSRNFCKLPYYDYWKEGYRSPKLQELYFKLFGNNFSNAHNSASDVKATKACFLELVNRGIIKLPTKSH